MNIYTWGYSISFHLYSHFRVFVNVNILAKEELRFTEPSYTFSTVAYSRVGEICGKVTVIHESSIQPLGTAENCGYSLPVSDIVPFTVDSHGNHDYL